MTPAALTEVPEKTTAYLTVTFKDKNGTQAAPTSATYRIDCLTTGAAILAATAMGAGSEVELTLTPAQNAILTATNKRETKRVTVVGTYGASDQVTEQYDYAVRNLSGVS